MGLPFQYVNVEQNQRADSADFVAIGTLALDNLHLALLNGFAPSDGWIMPGEMDWDSGMQCYLRTPLVVATSQGLVALASDESIVPAVGDGSNPRIDLVSVGWQAVDGSLEEKQFINTDTGASYPDDIVTRKRWEPVVTLTAGTPAASPSRPATPANHVALWEILVPTGATALTDDSFTLIPSEGGNQRGRLQMETWPTTGSTAYTSPYTSPTIVEVETPDNSVSAIVAQIRLMPNDDDIEDILIKIEDVDSSAVIGTAWIKSLAQSDHADLLVLGTIAGATSGRRKYRFRVTWSGDGQFIYIPTTSGFSQRVVALTL